MVVVAKHLSVAELEDRYKALRGRDVVASFSDDPLCQGAVQRQESPLESSVRLPGMKARIA